MTRAAHKRTNFSNAQKAAIYVRDRATCAFSGLSLWLFDGGVRSTTLVDWVDHVVPSSRGGLATLENGVCASCFHNAKKRANAADNAYLVRDGRITEHYVRTIGRPPEPLLADLKRRSNLLEADWHLNRAIALVFDGF